MGTGDAVTGIDLVFHVGLQRNITPSELQQLNIERLQLIGSDVSVRLTEKLCCFPQQPKVDVALVVF